MKPLISVIVPVYNVTDYVEQCINSLISQTMKELEIIVVDDCGTDDSIKKVEKLAKADKRIKIIYNKTNQGLGESRNIGLQYVKTEYVAFLDSDDWVEDCYYEKLYKAIKKENADIAISDVIYYYNEYEQKHEWVSNWNFKADKNIITEIKDKQYNIYSCACWNKLYKTNIFSKYNLKFPKGLYIEDVPITFITTMLAEKIVLVKDVKLYYRIRNNSIMSLSKGDRKPFDIFKIYDYTENLLKNYNTYNFIKQYQKILDNFEIFNVYSWYTSVHQIYKDEFWQQMRKVFLKINIKHNPYITSESRKIYNLVCHNDRILSVVYIKLFDLIPLFKFKKTEHSSSLYLFNLIPLYLYKYKTK